MHRILFVYPGPRPSSFMVTDRDILARHYRVTPLAWLGKRSALAVGRALRGSDAAYAYFLGHQAAVCAMVARRTAKVSIAVAAGEEVTPRNLLGNPPRRLRDRWATSYALRGTDLVLAVSRCTLHEAALMLPPSARSEVRYLPNGVDTERFRPIGDKEDLVLSVSVMEASAARRKRLDLVVEAARYVPEARFVLPGPWVDGLGPQLARNAPPNVDIPGELGAEELVALYQRAKVYVQASVHESFGMANAEAMACGCVPVVSRGGALPEVVGDTGLYLPEPPTPKDIAAAVRQALRSDLGARARTRIVEHYGLRKREAALVDAVEDALAGRLRPGVRA